MHRRAEQHVAVVLHFHTFRVAIIYLRITAAMLALAKALRRGRHRVIRDLGLLSQLQLTVAEVGRVAVVRAVAVVVAPGGRALRAARALIPQCNALLHSPPV